MENKTREEKQLYGCFKRQTRECAQTYLRRENPEKETGSLNIAQQNIAIRTSHIKTKIDNL